MDSDEFRKKLFFSSRRRHTRFDCDWSSDVCSSDLVAQHLSDGAPVRQRRAKQVGAIEKSDLEVGVDFDFTREIVVDAEHWTKPRNGIGREQWRDCDGVEFAVEHNKRIGGVVRLGLLDQFWKRKRHVVHLWAARVKKKFLIEGCDQYRIGSDPAAETR